MVELELLNKYTIHKAEYIYMGSYTETRYEYIDKELYNNLYYETYGINYILCTYLRHYAQR